MTAAADAHFATPDHLRGWVMVRATENTPEALLEALKASACYASTCPETHDIHFLDGEVEVSCSDASTIMYQGDGTATATLHGQGMIHERLSLARVVASPWLGVTSCDAAGKRAWSNPVWIEET